MFTVGHLAKLLDKGGFVGLFLADTFGPYDTYKGSAEPSVRIGAQWPLADPIIPVSAMAAVTKNLGFATTTSTSYEQAYVVAKRFSTLDHLTKGRFGWNIVTSWKESASKAVGLPLVEHDTHYSNADEYLWVLYKLWEGSWSDTALVEDAKKGIYCDYSQIRAIHHHGKFHVDAPFLTDPFPPTYSRAVPGRHISAIREGAIGAGRDPYSVKIFAMITPIIGKDEEDAKRKYEEALKYVLIEGGLAQFSATTGIDVSQFDLDHELTEEDVASHLQRTHSSLYNLRYQGDDVPKLTARNLGTVTAIGGNGAMPVGTAAQFADVFQEWVDIADVDGFNIGYVVTPGSFKDAVEYLVPELRSRGLLPEAIPEDEPAPTFREQIYGLGQKGLRSDHPYDTYEDTVAKEDAAKATTAEL
ncbi:DszA family Xenobiotic compound monooxygenase [Colletotrichum salicis]|uniref:DszA family Xenobiotic compound monooxygenase n=1 Tax=Colletotrichum salicis TaxID=1209931 RepID=A0A135VA69_9PEZI|nr:DszA family Xenobiotic compound monooxygenase [Colletotrichum salicis]